MYGLMFPRNYGVPSLPIVFESVTDSYEEVLESWQFAKAREAINDPLYRDVRLVMFSADDRSVWTELQSFYSKSGAQ